VIVKLSGKKGRASMNAKVRAKIAQVPGARTIVKGLRNLREHIFMPLRQTMNEYEAMLKILADTNFRMRAMMKHAQNKPINVLFVCHEPALWSMFESVYEAMENDSKFCPLVVALPYKHGTLPEGQYKDAGMFEYCESRNIKVVRGYNKGKDEWLQPATLDPDYVFFQTPYSFFPQCWLVRQVAMIAKVCYIPYATCLFRGEVEASLHPESFFQHTQFVFKESIFSRDLFIKNLRSQGWLKEDNVILCGHPKLDYLINNNQTNNGSWKRGQQKDIKRIIWTPRWNTSEGNCHFFDYKDFFVSYCKENKNVDFIFRPHPLCLQNFLNTGELSQKDLSMLEIQYDQSLNMILDKSAEYKDSFLTSDILVSDISSMLLEYLGTGKPIIYTHRINVFNELGIKLSEGLYWVNNVMELKKTIDMLISGNDPLLIKRKQLMSEILYMPNGGSGLAIKDVIKTDFNQYSTTSGMRIVQ